MNAQPINDREQAQTNQDRPHNEHVSTRKQTRHALWLLVLGGILEIWTVLDWPTNKEALASRSYPNKIATIAALWIWLAGMFKLWAGGDRNLVASTCACSTVVSYACLLFEVGKREALVVITVAQLGATSLYFLWTPDSRGFWGA